MKRKLITLFLITAIAILSVAAKADTEALFEAFNKAALDHDISLSMEKYSKLEKAIAKEEKRLEKALEEAKANGDRNLYYETLKVLASLDRYSIGKEESKALEEQIVETQNVKAASWLYENSPYYNPTLTIRAESSGENYSFSNFSRKSYMPGDEITLPTSIEGTSYAGILKGFGLTPDTIDYMAGESITMPFTDLELYALFTPGVTFTDKRTGFTSGHIEAKKGDTITVPSIQDTDDAIFAGFVDIEMGSYIGAGETEYTLTSDGASFEALWKDVKIDSLSLGGYKADSLVKGVQIPVSFSVTNEGNTDLYDAAVEITVSGEGARLVNTSAYARVLRAETTSSVNGTRLIIDRNTPEGTAFTLTVTLTDGSGTVFTKDFELKV